MKIAPLIYVFISALSVYSVWLYKYECSRGEASTGPGVVGEVMLFRKEWYKIDELRRWRAEDVVVYTFFRDGHYTESKGE